MTERQQQEQRALVQVRGVKKNYPRQRVDAGLWARAMGSALGWTGWLDDWSKLNEGLPVLRGVDLDVYEGEVLAIVGLSGAGKSTLLHLMGALDHVNEGEIRVDGRSLGSLGYRELARWRNHNVGFVFQSYHLFPDLDALENVLLPSMVAYSFFQYRARRQELIARAKQLLEQVGLGDRIHHVPSQLSGGEQQRVAIARALILDPQLVLCDEPTGNLDRATGEKVLEVLLQLKRDKGQTYVIVTHDRRLAARADRIVRMVDGQLSDFETEELEDVEIPEARLSGPSPAPAPEDAPPPGPDAGPDAGPDLEQDPGDPPTVEA